MLTSAYVCLMQTESVQIPFTIAEFEDVRNGLMVRRGLDRYVPLRLYRHWGHRVLSVTDLSGGMWCEVQLEYRHLHPHLKNSKAWTEMAEKGSPVVLKTETMKKGSVVHMNKGEVSYF